MSYDEQSRLLKALADPVRLKILDILRKEQGTISVFELVEHFNLEQPSVSHHLRILLDACLIERRKKSLYVYYHLRPETLEKARQIIEAITAQEVAV